MNEQSIVDALLANNIPAEVVYTGGGFEYAEVQLDLEDYYLSIGCDQQDQFTGEGNETAYLQVNCIDDAPFNGQPFDGLVANLPNEQAVVDAVRANLHRISKQLDLFSRSESE